MSADPTVLSDAIQGITANLIKLTAESDLTSVTEQDGTDVTKSDVAKARGASRFNLPPRSSLPFLGVLKLCHSSQESGLIRSSYLYCTCLRNKEWKRE